MSKLSLRQERFCQEYVVDCNGTQAAIRAGYSKKTAQEQSSRLLCNVIIDARVKELLQKKADKIELTHEKILSEIYKLATVDISQAYDESGWLKPMSEIPPDVRRAISYIKTHELFQGNGDDKSIIGVNKDVRFYDRTKALEMLGKHLKLFTDRIEHRGKFTLEDLVAPDKEDSDKE